MASRSNDIRLNVPFQLNLLPLLTSSVEQALQAFGFGRTETMHLTLAVEEMYSFLAPQSQADQRLELAIRHGGYYAEVIFRFSQQSLPLEAFNITASVATEDAKSLAEMGLLLAARTVDHLRVFAEQEGMSVHFVKEKAYPKVVEPPPDDVFQEFFRSHEPDAELLKQFARRVAGKYGAQALACFNYPGKVVDMVESGEYEAALLVDVRGNVGAGIFWRRGLKQAEAFGPFVFAGTPDLAVQSVEACLNRLARTSSICLVMQNPTPDLPEGYFERLSQEQPLMYRQLEEDNGAAVYACPALAQYLRTEYRRLCLPRQIHEVAYQGEILPERSAFATQLDAGAKKARLRSLWVGADSRQTLQDHILALRKEKFADIIFLLELADSRQASLGEALLATGFLPRVIMPWGGIGDILILAHQEKPQ